MDIRLIYTDADRVEQGYLKNFNIDAVSYTHLTLPTNSLV